MPIRVSGMVYAEDMVENDKKDADVEEVLEYRCIGQHQHYCYLYRLLGMCMHGFDIDNQTTTHKMQGWEMDAPNGSLY